MVADADWLWLDEGEQVVWWGQPRLRRILPAVGKAGVWVTIFLGVAILGPAIAPEGIAPIVVTAGGVVLALLGMGPAVRAYLRTRNVYYVLTDRNIYRKRAVLSTTVTRVGVANVQNTRLHKSVLGRLFDYGSIAISSAGSRGADLVIADLNDPETVRAELQALMGPDRPRGTDPLAALDAAVGADLLAEARAMRRSAERIRGVIVE